MSFPRSLIAVDRKPIAAHAADVGAELARSLGADATFVHVIDASPGYGADIGISPNELIERAKQDGKRLLESFRQRLSLQPSALEFVVAGTPADEVVKAAVLVIRAKE